MTHKPVPSLEQHALVAGMFPPAQNDEITALGDDIRDRGQLLLPIWLYDNHVIDGWQRYLACRKHGVEPVFQTWNGPADQLPGLVLALKLKRQHLSSSQRAAVAVKLLPELERAAAARKRSGKKADHPQTVGGGGKHKGEATEQAAGLVGTNRDYVNKAKRLSRLDPDLFDRVWRGEVNIPLADLDLQDRLDRLRLEGPDLVTEVEQERLTLPDALKQLDARLRKQKETNPGPDEAGGHDTPEPPPHGTGRSADRDTTSRSENQPPTEPESNPLYRRWLTLRRAKTALRRWTKAGYSGDYDTATRTFRLRRRGRPIDAVSPHVFWIDDTEFVVWPAGSFNTD